MATPAAQKTNGTGPPQVAVVTGGLGAIGSAIVTGLEAAGFETAVADAGVSTSAGGRFPLDVTDDRSCAGLAAEVADHFGRPARIVVNCAGVMLRGSITELDLDAAQRLHGVNVWGAQRIAREFVPGMRAAGFGRIVNISSVQAWKGLDGYSAYASSKAALNALTRVWARELGPHGITVNTVAPGYVDAPMISGLFDRLAAAGGCSADEARDRLLSDVAIRRLIRPEEIAAVVSFLASEASSGVNGADLTVDGGYALM